MKTTTLKIYADCLFSLLKTVTIALLVTSCDSFVDVELPKSQLTHEAVFNNNATANAALTDIYSKLRDQGLLAGTASGLSYELGLYTDELSSYASAGNPALPFFNNTLLPANSTITDYWNNSYNQIYAANTVLEGTEQSTKLTEQEKKTLIGEALFIRALIHFYLTNLYGSIPYITSTDYKINQNVRKIAAADIYEFIIKDLESAAVLLDPVYKNSDRIRPNQFVVKALLARVYLYKSSWAEASNAASSVLNAASLYNLENNISAVFLKNAKETIWQFQPSATGKNTDEAAIFMFFSGPPPLVSLSNNLINAFSADDLRKLNWIGVIKNGTNTWYYSYKYKEFNSTALSLEYSKIFRLAEQYLIRAEARARQGDLIGAKEDLNKIRKRAGLQNTDAVSQQEILNAILKERRLEFFTEHGHRFFDLKRSATIDAVLSVSKAGWSSGDVLFPIPQNELSANPNLLPQNSGY